MVSEPRPYQGTRLAKDVIDRILTDSASFRRTLALIVVSGLTLMLVGVGFALLGMVPLLCGVGGGVLGIVAVRRLP